MRCGPDSITILCLYAVPTGTPTEVQIIIINSTAVKIVWFPPLEDQQNGNIVHYSLMLSGNESGHLMLASSISNTTSIGLSGLRPFSEYNVSLAANTAVGVGPFTSLHTFYTPEDGEI